MKTATTELSKYSKCIIRNKMVANTPEERVRQSFLRRMIQDLGFHKGLISIEKGIGQRRYDLVCYSQAMTPLVLIECKAVKLDDTAIRQAFGYNGTVKAPFVCLVSPFETKTFWQEQDQIASVDFLPVYNELYGISKRL